MDCRRQTHYGCCDCLVDEEGKANWLQTDSVAFGADWNVCYVEHADIVAGVGECDGLEGIHGEVGKGDWLSEI